MKPELLDLKEQIKFLEKDSNLTIGVDAKNILSGASFYYNSSVMFPLSSTVKVIVAASVLNLVEQKKINLSDKIILNFENIVPGSGVIKQAIFIKKKIKASLRYLLYHMLINSDNTATDALIEVIGGIEQLKSFLVASDLQNIYINDNIEALMIKASGFQDIKNSFSLYKSIQNDPFLSFIPNEVKINAAKFFDQDNSNSCAPEAMNNFLIKLFNYKILSINNTNYLLDIMKKCLTGTNRIKAQLPLGLIIAHKTGTWNYGENFINYMYTSDIGIITSDQHDKIIILSIYIKSNSKLITKLSQHESIIAKTAFTLFNSL